MLGARGRRQVFTCFLPRPLSIGGRRLARVGRMIASEEQDDRAACGMPRQGATVSNRAELVVQRAMTVAHPAARATLPSELRLAIVELCAQARTERVPVERMIVSLKEQWGSHPAMRHLPHGVGEDTLLDCVITQCILDFYADAGPESGPSNRPRTRADRNSPEQRLPS